MTIHGKRSLVATVVALGCIAPGLVMADAPTDVAALIAKLGDSDFFVREEAQQELAEYGVEAFDALMIAQFDDDVEIATRATYLLHRIDIDWVTSADALTAQHLLTDYDTLEADDRAERIDQLGQLIDQNGVQPLCRLVRFEQDEVLSRRAAVTLLMTISDDLNWPSARKSLQRQLQSSPRVAAAWIRAYRSARDDPESDYANWSEVVEAEQSAFAKRGPDTNRDVVAGLWQIHAEFLQRLALRDEAREAMRNATSLDRDSPLRLARRMRWLAGHGAVEIIDEVEADLRSTENEVAYLWYVLAEARREFDDDAAAAQLEQFAQRLHPGKQAPHYAVAQALRDDGLFAAAEKEFELATNLGNPGRETTIFAQSYWAEMLHDLERHREAAERLQKLVESLREQANRRQSGADLNSLRPQLTSRAHYFLACEARDAGETDKQREHLDTSVKNYRRDVESLIALDRLLDDDDEGRPDLEKMIQETAVHYDRGLAQSRSNGLENHSYLNQAAWLLANTNQPEKTYRKALEYSLRSLERSPHNAGYLDTLARCHFALGQYREAVDFQRQAVFLDPHVRQMQRQLSEFEAALSAQTAN